MLYSDNSLNRISVVKWRCMCLLLATTTTTSYLATHRSDFARSIYMLSLRIFLTFFFVFGIRNSLQIALLFDQCWVWQSSLRYRYTRRRTQNFEHACSSSFTVTNLMTRQTFDSFRYIQHRYVQIIQTVTRYQYRHVSYQTSITVIVNIMTNNFATFLNDFCRRIIRCCFPFSPSSSSSSSLGCCCRCPIVSSKYCIHTNVAASSLAYCR